MTSPRKTNIGQEKQAKYFVIEQWTHKCLITVSGWPEKLLPPVPLLFCFYSVTTGANNLSSQAFITFFSVAMASHLAVRTSPMALHHSLGITFATRRYISTSLRATQATRGLKSGILHPAFQQSSRRAYSDAPTVNLSPSPKRKQRFKVLRWTWRLTYLSAIGFVGWLSYTVWELRNPNDQFDPDPSKKTLVILGRYKAVGGWNHLC